MHITVENRLILASVKIYPKQEDLEKADELISQITDWDYFTKTCIDAGVGPLFYKKLDSLKNAALIPDEVKEKLEQVYFRTLSRSMVLYDAFAKVAEAFQAEGITFMALKGIYLAEWLYQDIGTRQFSDIDLLIQEEDGEKCIALLNAMGYDSGIDTHSEFVSRKSEVVHYSPLYLNGVSIELHIKLHRYGEKYKINLAELWKNAVPVLIHARKALAPDLYDLLIHVCLHLDRHFQQGRIQFTGFIDIANLLDIHSNLINWDEFISRCRIYQCENEVFRYIVLVHNYMNISIPDNLIGRYGALVRTNDEEKLFEYLEGRWGFISGLPNHASSLQSMKKNTDRLRYILGILFPPKAFIKEKYNIKKRNIVLFYYLYRYWEGVKGIFRL